MKKLGLKEQVKTGVLTTAEALEKLMVNHRLTPCKTSDWLLRRRKAGKP